MCILELTSTVFVLQIKTQEPQISKQHIWVPFHFPLAQIHCVDAEVPKSCGLKSVPQRFRSSKLPVPASVTWCWNRVFADDQVKESSLGWAMIQYNCVLLGSEKLDNATCTQAERFVNMKVEIGVMYLHVKQCQRLLANCQS